MCWFNDNKCTTQEFFLSWAATVVCFNNMHIFMLLKLITYIIHSWLKSKFMQWIHKLSLNHEE